MQALAKYDLFGGWCSVVWCGVVWCVVWCAVLSCVVLCCVVCCSVVLCCVLLCCVLLCCVLLCLRSRTLEHDAEEHRIIAERLCRRLLPRQRVIDVEMDVPCGLACLEGVEKEGVRQLCGRGDTSCAARTLLVVS